MDSRGGGCCIARYNNGSRGGGYYPYDMSKVNRILLRYRPIAPKPAAGGSITKSSAEEPPVKGGRGRRTAVQNYLSNKEKNSKSGNRKRKVSMNHRPAVVTLQLLPESPERKDSPASGCSSESTEVGDVGVTRPVPGAPIWLSFDEKNNDRNINNCNGSHVMGHVTGGMLSMFQKQQEMKRIVRSCVKVESLAYTWLADPYGLGQTDDEKVMSLQKDTCPGFISDGANRMSWANRSFKAMFGGGEREEEAEAEVAVRLVLRDGMELGCLNCGGFTCQVRVVTCVDGNGKNSSSLTLPCDVWRMDFGGFAWRLDTKAALSLGR